MKSLVVGRWCEVVRGGKKKEGIKTIYIYIYIQSASAHSAGLSFYVCVCGVVGLGVEGFLAKKKKKKGERFYECWLNLIPKSIHKSAELQ